LVAKITSKTTKRGGGGREGCAGHKSMHNQQRIVLSPYYTGIATNILDPPINLQSCIKQINISSNTKQYEDGKHFEIVYSDLI
jgi:hypothetical protein